MKENSQESLWSSKLLGAKLPMPAQPVTDRYSSDDSQDEEKEKSQGYSSLYNVLTYNGSTVTIETVKRYFNLEFHTIAHGPTQEDLNNMNIPDIMEHMLHFVTKRRDLSGKAMIETVLEKNGKETAMHELYHNKIFHINFKDPDCPIAFPVFDDKDQSFNVLRDRDIQFFMENLLESFELSREIRPVDSKHHYEVVKHCMTSFCRLTTNKVKERGKCINLMEATAARTCSQTGIEKTRCVSFKSSADLIWANNIHAKPFPGIPFEVYSPCKKTKIRTKGINNPKKAKKDISDSSSYTTTNSTSTATNGVITDEESGQPLSNFLSSNIPRFMCERSQSPNVESTFKSKFVAQHVLQILGSASEYCHRKLYRGEKMQKSKVFIGLLVCDEYVYITKLQGDESCFAKYFPKEPSAIILGKHSLSERLQGARGRPQRIDVDPRIHVQFSSMALDMFNHNHRMALVFFMEYFSINWDNIMSAAIE